MDSSTTILRQINLNCAILQNVLTLKLRGPKFQVQVQ